MAEPPLPPDSEIPDGSPGEPPESPVAEQNRSGGGAPRWVKLFGVITIVVIALFLVALLIPGGPGRHGPGRHMPGNDAPTGQSPAPGGHNGGSGHP